MTLNQFLTALTLLVTNIIDWMTDIWQFIVSDEILMVCTIGIGLVGLAVGFLHRILRLS